MAVNHLQKQRGRGQGRPFTRGNSSNPAGRPIGSRNQATEQSRILESYVRAMEAGEFERRLKELEAARAARA